MKTMKKILPVLLFSILAIFSWTQRHNLPQSVLFIDVGVQNFQQLFGGIEDNITIRVLDLQNAQSLVSHLQHDQMTV